MHQIIFWPGKDVPESARVSRRRRFARRLPAHRRSRRDRSIGDSCGRRYWHYRLDDLTAQMLAARTNNGLPISLTRPSSVFLVSSRAAELFASDYGSMVVDSRQFRLIGAAECRRFVSWRHPALRDGGLDSCAATRAGRVAGCAIPLGRVRLSCAVPPRPWVGVLRRAIAPQHTEVSQLAALGANDSSIRRSPFLTVRRALSAHTTSVVPMTTSHAPATIASTTMELIGQTIVTTPAITVRIPTKMYQPRAGNAGTRSPMRSP